MPKVLVLYYSRHGAVRAMAQEIAYGIEAANGEAILRTVAPLDSQQTSEHAYVSLDDLAQCDALALGSPSRFGNMAAPMKAFWETSSKEWLSGALIDKPASVFTSSSSMHGGNESTLLTMMIPLMHHGMLIQSLPYSEPALHRTSQGGTPYGVSHVSGVESSPILTDDEVTLCRAVGRRLTQLADTLSSNTVKK